MAVEMQVMGDRDGAYRLVHVLSDVVELKLRRGEYGMRGNPAGCRWFGAVRPRASTSTGVAVRSAALVAGLPVRAASGESVRLRLGGEEPELVAVLSASAALYVLRFPPEDHPRDGAFGRDVYLHTFTGHLPPVPAGWAPVFEPGGRGGVPGSEVERAAPRRGRR
ncbi:MAG: hypothetical protein HOV94_40310, partial [Saccharothrix sp.]|nr:hypothetical protein [Saccharothrix sp.]